MTRKPAIVKINFPGGIVPSGELLAIVKAATQAGIRAVRFGGRQQMLMEVPPDRLEQLLADLSDTALTIEVDADRFPNIVSSCVAEQVVHFGGWLREGVYKDVLDGFEEIAYHPRISVNLVDQGQSLVPFGSGTLNFIASCMGNYWHLLVRATPQGKLHEWKSLVYSENIPRLARRLEGFLLDGPVGSEALSMNRIYTEVMQAEQWTEQPSPEPMSFPDFALPYYEGFNRYGERLWLGIYRRDELFPLSFLNDLCSLCLQTKIAQVYTTPWKSMIIQGIGRGDRKGWDIILGRHGINVRHSLCELSWQVEDLSLEGLSLKHHLVRQFDRDDIRTFGLCFAIQLSEGTSPFGLILIRKQPARNSSKRKTLDRYDILYQHNFDAQADDYVLFRKDIEKEHLSAYLISLCAYFYECKAGDEMILHHVYRHKDAQTVSITPSGQLPVVYQCVHCLTVYDPALGDPDVEIPAGTPFDNLIAYDCPVCASDKSSFIPIKIEDGRIFCL